ncbi:MAG: hypothetical protein ACR2G5_18310 [Pyrinomonadaceae bacterium]
MKAKTERQAESYQRRTERGAALVTTLLISTLLLAAGLSVVMSTSLSSTTAIDSAAEMQAYSGAEAGIEATLNALRGNVNPDSSLAGTSMNFRNAARPDTSNNTTDPKRSGSGAEARLSGWLNYTYQVTNDWRVPVTASYTPVSGIAFKITISDPDDSGPIATRRIMTDPNYNPERLLIHSEGYGPKGARKKLEMIVRNSAFEFSPAAPVSLFGEPAIFDLGTSSSVDYSGVDLAPSPKPSLPTFAVSSGDIGTAQGVVDGMGAGQVTPSGVVSSDNTLPYLASGDAARTFLGVLRALAAITPAGNRVFASQAAADAAGGLGTPTAPKTTFIDNYGTGATPGPPVTLGSGPQGAGMLIVTGELETNGNTDFEGIIFVLGRGKITRSGGGDGLLQGAFVVANFDPNGAPGSGFGSPTYSISGGGTSTVAYDSEAVRRALELTGVKVVGVREHH